MRITVAIVALAAALSSLSCYYLHALSSDPDIQNVSETDDRVSSSADVGAFDDISTAKNDATNQFETRAHSIELSYFDSLVSSIGKSSYSRQCNQYIRLAFAFATKQDYASSITQTNIAIKKDLTKKCPMAYFLKAQLLLRTYDALEPATEGSRPIISLLEQTIDSISSNWNVSYFNSLLNSNSSSVGNPQQHPLAISQALFASLLPSSDQEQLRQQREDPNYNSLDEIVNANTSEYSIVCLSFSQLMHIGMNQQLLQRQIRLDERQSDSIRRKTGRLEDAFYDLLSNRSKYTTASASANRVSLHRQVLQTIGLLPSTAQSNTFTSATDLLATSKQSSSTSIASSHASAVLRLLQRWPQLRLLCSACWLPTSASLEQVTENERQFAEVILFFIEDVCVPFDAEKRSLCAALLQEFLGRFGSIVSPTDRFQQLMLLSLMLVDSNATEDRATGIQLIRNELSSLSMSTDEDALDPSVCKQLVAERMELITYLGYLYWRIDLNDAAYTIAADALQKLTAQCASDPLTATDEIRLLFGRMHYLAALASTGWLLSSDGFPAVKSEGDRVTVGRACKHFESFVQLVGDLDALSRRYFARHDNCMQQSDWEHSAETEIEIGTESEAETETETETETEIGTESEAETETETETETEIETESEAETETETEAEIETEAATDKGHDAAIAAPETVSIPSAMGTSAADSSNQNSQQKQRQRQTTPKSRWVTY